MRKSGRIHLVATAIDALHHGKGVAGNTQLLRTQDIVLPDGTAARVPFISGNSLKHMIREGSVRFALDAMGIEDGTLSKPVIDLLFSGGSLSKTGSSVNLSNARAIETLFPALSMCGYSAGNTMVESKIRVDNLHLVCRENAWRIPPDVKDAPHAAKPSGYFRSEEFGTRHEPTRRQGVNKLLDLGDQLRLESHISSSQKKKNPEKKDSLQMIYEFETLKPGSMLWGCFYLEDLTSMELTALKAGLSHVCNGVAQDGGLIYYVGAKSSIGNGRISIKFKGFIKESIRPTAHTDDNALVQFSDGDPDLAKYVSHLTDNQSKILSSFATLV